uniref:Uncharacterized protein n=1 Tax=Rhizophora mucronata TaxID=61149 RepID=A0A2P2NQF4_RHIMU
MKNRQGRFL